MKISGDATTKIAGDKVDIRRIGLFQSNDYDDEDENEFDSSD